MKQKNLVQSFLLLGLLLPAAALATDTPAAEEVSYGEVFVVQKKDIAQEKWQYGAAYTYGFSNPYIGIHGLQLEFDRKLTDFVSIGLSPSVFATTDKGVASEIASELGTQSIQTNVYRPRASGYLVVGLSPLSGMLNWWNTSTVDFDFRVGMGVGGASYRSERKLLPSAKLFATPQVMISKSLGFNAGIQAVFDRFSDKSWQNRFDTLIGLVGRF